MSPNNAAVMCGECGCEMEEHALSCGSCGTPTTLGRVLHAQQALDVMTSASGEDRKDQLTDLLADLMHFCKVTGIPFDRQLRYARSHFASE
jgi:hypothetical protein